MSGAPASHTLTLGPSLTRVAPAAASCILTSHHHAHSAMQQPHGTAAPPARAQRCRPLARARPRAHHARRRPAAAVPKLPAPPPAPPLACHASRRDEQAVEARQPGSPLSDEQPPQGKAGTVWGSALLVAGTTIGAGILALPAVTQDAGFVPAATTLTGVCIFSVATGLLLAETSLRLRDERGSDTTGSVGMVSMASSIMGPVGAAATSAAYLFLHYALLVAYMSKAAEIFNDVTGLPLLPLTAAFAGGFGLLCYLSPPTLLDSLNGGLVGLVIVCFVGLLAVAGAGVDADILVHQGDWSAVPATLPVVALAFVYHNVVPVIVTALQGDAARIRTAICAGVAIPWLMFVSWEGAILGSLGSLSTPPQPQAAAARAGAAASIGDGREAPPLAASSSPASVADPLLALQQASPVAAPLIQLFSFLAILTSFIGFVLGLTDFLADALRLPSRQAPLPYLVTLLPPFMVTLFHPNIFLAALDTAGTYGVLTLFGILPPAMAWQLRYGAGRNSSTDSSSEGSSSKDMLPLGRPLLLVVGGAAAGVVLNELVQLVAGRG